MIKEINSYDLHKLLKTKKINLIDIRDNYTYSLGTIENSINIPANSLIINPSKYLNYNDNYYIFCNSGYTSKELCNILVAKGYNVINIIGGYYDYKRSNF